jgi:WD40 repeat protein
MLIIFLPFLQQIWTFRQGGKKIAPAQIIEEGLGDSGSGPVSVLHMEDVPGRAQRCFAAVNSGIKVYQVCSGRLLSSHPSLHHCPLSSLLFFRPLTLLLSADTDGAIKVWDTSWRLCCTFIGHCEAVTALSPYPHGPLVISGSLDSTLRVWDLTSQDQVDCLDNGAPVRGLHTSPGTPHILTHSHTLVRGWRVQQLYKRSAIIGREILSLSSTTHPMVPRRLLASCADSAVRLVCPVGGHVITTALLPPGQCVHSLVHFPLTESLYVLEEGGTVTVFNTSQTPSPVTAHWTAPTSLGQFTCLAHYEQTMDEEDVEEMLAEDRWMGVVLEARKLSRLSLYTKDPLTVQREGMSLLLAGTNGGHIALIDHTTGDIQFHLKLHSGPVTLLACDAKQNYIFSASNDCQIFISKLHPHIQESISVMMSFDVTFCPSFICITPDRVGVACNNHAHSSFTIDMYCLQDGASFTGDPENGHQAAITGLVSFPRLHLFASTGLDRTLRIWTANNHPVRVLQLDVSPSSLVFSSPSAHLTLSLHRHLHSIDPSTSLPEQLLNQLVSMTTDDVEETPPREMISDHSTLTPEDLERLEVVDDTIQQEAYKGALSVEEMTELEDIAREKVAGMSLLVEKDNEIRGILNGTVLASRKRAGLRAGDRERAWQAVLSLLHPRRLHPPINIPEDDDFDPDTYGQPKAPVEPYSPYRKGPRLSFFPPLATFEPPYPVAPDGILPNSALLQVQHIQ